MKRSGEREGNHRRESDTTMYTWPQADVIQALGGVAVLVIAAVGAAVARIVSEVRKQHIATQEKQAQQDKKLDNINNTTQEALSNTNGNLSELRQELARRTAREEVLERMVSELTSILSSQRAAGAAAAGALQGSRRATDPPIAVRVVEAETRKNEGTA